MVEAEAELKALMVRSLGGDGAAYAALLKKLNGYLRAYYRRRLGRAADAEDLLQETLIAMHTRRATYDPTRPFTAWVHAIARYKLIDYFRRTKRRAEDPLDDPDLLFGSEETSAAEAGLDIDRLLGQLPARTQALIRDTRIEGLSTAEAAARHGVSESAVKVGVHRGLKALGAKLEDGER
ncbi:MAG TPA: sigma-70 family RNA polymerase sigma factor [Rhizomicrobium sp.]